jgi:hypothetical protein
MTNVTATRRSILLPSRPITRSSPYLAVPVSGLLSLPIVTMTDVQVTWRQGRGRGIKHGESEHGVTQSQRYVQEWLKADETDRQASADHEVGHPDPLSLESSSIRGGN